MSFFDDLPSIPPLAQDLENHSPPWLAPPHNYIGALAPLRLIVARTSEVAVALSGIMAYPSGLECQMVVRSRKLQMKPDFFGTFQEHPSSRRRRSLSLAWSNPTVPK